MCKSEAIDAIIDLIQVMWPNFIQIRWQMKFLFILQTTEKIVMGDTVKKE